MLLLMRGLGPIDSEHDLVKRYYLMHRNKAYAEDDRTDNLKNALERLQALNNALLQDVELAVQECHGIMLPEDSRSEAAASFDEEFTYSAAGELQALKLNGVINPVRSVLNWLQFAGDAPSTSRLAVSVMLPAGKPSIVVALNIVYLRLHSAIPLISLC